MMEILAESGVMLGGFELASSLILLWALQKITTISGFKTKQARWALFRRAVYCQTSVALFGLGIEHLIGDDYRSVALLRLFSFMLVFGVMVFPLLRAIGAVSQDFFLYIDGARPGAVDQYYYDKDH